MTDKLKRTYQIIGIVISQIVNVPFVAGAAIGLAYAWLIDPLTFSESSPAQTMKPYREAWLIMSAEAYAQDGDWERTQARVNALRDANLARTIVEFLSRTFGENRPQGK